jgi:hypothetical protein
MRLLYPQEAKERIEIFVTLPNGKRLPQVGRISGGGYEFDPLTQVIPAKATDRDLETPPSPP